MKNYEYFVAYLCSMVFFVTFGILGYITNVDVVWVAATIAAGAATLMIIIAEHEYMDDEEYYED